MKLTLDFDFALLKTFNEDQILLHVLENPAFRSFRERFFGQTIKGN
jgi:hypothetical protein